MDFHTIKIVGKKKQRGEVGKRYAVNHWPAPTKNGENGPLKTRSEIFEPFDTERGFTESWRRSPDEKSAP